MFTIFILQSLEKLFKKCTSYQAPFSVTGNAIKVISRENYTAFPLTFVNFYLIPIKTRRQCKFRVLVWTDHNVSTITFGGSKRCREESKKDTFAQNTSHQNEIAVRNQAI